MTRDVETIFAAPERPEAAAAHATPATSIAVDFPAIMRAIAACGSSTTEKALLYAMVAHRDGKSGAVVASVDTIALGAGVQLRAAQLTIRRFEAAGVIRRIHASVGGRKNVNVWALGVDSVGRLPSPDPAKPRTPVRRSEKAKALGNRAPACANGASPCAVEGAKPRTSVRITAHPRAHVSSIQCGPLPADAVAVAPTRRPTSVEVASWRTSSCKLSPVAGGAP